MRHANLELRHENNSVRHRQTGLTLARMRVSHPVFNPSWPAPGIAPTARGIPLSIFAKQNEQFRCEHRGDPTPPFFSNNSVARSLDGDPPPICRGSNGNSRTRGGGGYADFRKTTINIVGLPRIGPPDRVVQPLRSQVPND